MPRTRLFWVLAIPIVVSLVVAAAIGGWRLTQELESRRALRLEDELTAHARLFREILPERPTRETLARLRPAIAEFERHTDCDLMVVDSDGRRLLTNSRFDAPVRGNPEVSAALAGGVGRDRRDSPRLGAEVISVALPLFDTSARPVGAVVATAPLGEREPGTLGPNLAAALAVGLLLVLAAVGFAASRVASPIRRMEDSVRRASQGELSVRFPDTRISETQDLSTGLSTLTSELSTRLASLTRHMDEQERVLSSMVEGVLAVDASGHVMTLNRAAAALLQIEPGPENLGRPLEEVVRNPAIQTFAKSAIEAAVPTEEELIVHAGDPRHLRALGAAIRNPRGESLGAVVVFNDLTHMRRLESIRRDFVANVSHELKTPITSIKASVETLIEGAMRDEEHAERFLAIIARQSDRLAAIIEDLLSLSRIEQDAEGEGLERSVIPVREVVVSAADACRLGSERKSVELVVDCPETLRAPLNSHLLEQALVNLIDNAIKYSEEGGRVEVSAQPEGTGVMISVRDHGSGIEASHLERLFERFYRVDKARSRSLGGTGLGLAIVKHIAQAHGGTVSVSSKIGEGSTFTIHLPERGDRGTF